MSTGKFREGDKVSVAGVVVDAEHIQNGWMTVAFTGYRVLVMEKDVELVEPATTPGQRAYDKWRASYHGDTLSWATLLDSEKELWEGVANAART